jgi:hypothetical protein
MENHLQKIDDKTLTEYIAGVGNVPQKIQTEFFQICKSLNLNPFLREVHLVGYGDKYNIVTSYTVYIARAEATGKLDGWKSEIALESGDMICRVTIYRKDWQYPFVHEAYLSECEKTSSIWKQMKKFMLKKTAIGQAFRLCFPELSGLPYEEAELETAEKEYTIVKKHSYTTEEVQQRLALIKNQSREDYMQVISKLLADGKIDDNICDQLVAWANEKFKGGVE